MKKYAPVVLCLLLTITATLAQEFKTYDGFIYTPTTMKRLNVIVDSMNLRFKTCDLSRKYYSKNQTCAHLISLSGQAKEAIKDMDKMLNLTAFLQKYPKAKVEYDLVFTRFEYDNAKEHVIEFSNISFESGYNREFKLTDNRKLLKHTWLYSEYEGSVQALFFPDEPGTALLPVKYAQLVQYADCLIDTNQLIFIGDKYSNRWETEKPEGAIKTLYESVDKFPGKPTEEEMKKSKSGWELFNNWETKRDEWVKESYSQTPAFKTQLEAAYAYAIKHNMGDYRLENYCSMVGDKKKVLDLKRRRRVMGSCSMDNSPRIHAQEIAVLAAENTQWDIFLRAHLDIMNDRFSRTSDGSYAQGGRKTYIGELEALGINVVDLVLGISLRVENASTNHYYGSINRLGRSIAESKFKKEFEDRCLHMIADSTLDDYNRILLYYLFVNYAYHLPDKSETKNARTKLAQAVQQLPKYISARIVEKKDKD